MPTIIDSVARSLWWTAATPARGRALRRPAAGLECSVPPLLDEDLSLEDALAATGVPDSGPAADALRRRASAVLADAQTAGVTPIPRGADEYPVALAGIPDPPPVLWVRGEMRAAEHAVAIVGSRAATPHALEVAHRLAEGLAVLGITVVSGLARGVDGAAHRGALAGQGRTLAVLGSGPDVIYPPEHRDLASRVARCGALVSELVPGTPPSGWHFPRRNRVISGLAAGVVVVEASAHSGSLITAARALEQQRAVMAVPGGVLSGRNRGAHGLLKDGARIVESVEDILEELHYVGAAAVLAAGAAGQRAAPADPILWAMAAGEPYDVAFLTEQTGLGTVRVLARLAELELGGWIQRVGGGRFMRSPRTC